MSALERTFTWGFARTRGAAGPGASAGGRIAFNEVTYYRRLRALRRRCFTDSVHFDSNGADVFADAILIAIKGDIR